MKKPYSILALISISFISCTPKPRPPSVGDNAIAIAKVGNLVITDQELLERISAIEKAYPRVYSTHVQKKNLLTEMMNTELLYQEALRIGLDKKFEFKSRLADLYVRELAEGARNQIQDKDIQDFFDEHKAAVEQISARHILLKTTAGMDSKRKAEIRKQIQKIHDELLQKPSSFPDFARKYSEDSSKDSGGELGFFTRGMMVPPFSSAAFKLKNVGDISDVVESQYGFHIIQLSGDRRGLEPYRSLIKEQLLRKTQRDRLDAEIAKLKSGKEFQIFEESLIKLSPLPDEVKTDPKELIPEGSVKVAPH